uniref:Uncharacterized protein n=1 Tax=Chenopodium quinoa TaxID=63459 RepID=A0A803M8L8_CHEQI
MADGGGGECCIARWGGGGHVAASGYNTTSKMDMIMLKFRPIAPKPVSGTAPASEGGSGSSGNHQLAWRDLRAPANKVVVEFSRDRQVEDQSIDLQVVDGEICMGMGR